MSDTTRFALALDAMEGVGRVTAGRLLTHFMTYEDLLRYPREQVMARIKGAPRSESLVATLFDNTAMNTRLSEADRLLDALHEQRVTVLTMQDRAWPHTLNALPRSNRPFLMYGFGHVNVLSLPLVALFARPPVSPTSFEHAQSLVRHLLPHGVAPATGALHGFDVVVHKLCFAGRTGYPSLLVASTGMAKALPSMRPTISAVVKAGGLFVSPFAMHHGPFDHDDKERTLILAAMAHACVFVDPLPGTPEWQALRWCLEAGRPVFGIAPEEHALPESVHMLRTDVDFDWVLAAVQTTTEEEDST